MPLPTTVELSPVTDNTYRVPLSIVPDSGWLGPGFAKVRTEGRLDVLLRDWLTTEGVLENVVVSNTIILHDYLYFDATFSEPVEEEPAPEEPLPE